MQLTQFELEWPKDAPQEIIVKMCFASKALAQLAFAELSEELARTNSVHIRLATTEAEPVNAP